MKVHRCDEYKVNELGRLLAAPAETYRNGHQHEALIERDLAEARQWQTEALKDNVISFFDPEDESVVKARPRWQARVLEDVRRDQGVGLLRAFAREPGIAAETDRGCRRVEKDSWVLILVPVCSNEIE